MQTTLRSAFITDLLLPPPHSLPNLTPAAISELGYTTAVNLLLDSEAFIRSNPLVTNVRTISSRSESKHYVDVPTFCTEFDVDPRGNVKRGVSDVWTQYEVTDKLNWGLGSSDIVYATAMRRIPGGFESLTNPGSGVRIYGRFEILRPSELGRLSANTPHLEQGASSHPPATTRDYNAGAPNAVPGWESLSTTTTTPSADTAEASADGVVHFIEHNETRCNALLGIYIKATNAKAHREMHEKFKRRWGEDIKRALAAELRVPVPGSRPGSAAQAGQRKTDGEAGVTGKGFGER